MAREVWPWWRFCHLFRYKENCAAEAHSIRFGGSMQAGQVKWIAMAGKIARRVLIVALIIYGIIFALDKRFPDRFYDCERDTKLLQGGVKIYRGVKYSVVLCGTGGDENFMGDKIRLQVFSD